MLLVLLGYYVLLLSYKQRLAQNRFTTYCANADCAVLDADALPASAYKDSNSHNPALLPLKAFLAPY